MVLKIIIVSLIVRIISIILSKNNVYISIIIIRISILSNINKCVSTPLNNKIKNGHANHALKTKNNGCFLAAISCVEVL